MHVHPDADAFVRAILRDPADLTARLVFADWLEETGEASNVAWAQFIRVMAETKRHPLGTAERRDLQREASDVGSQITAKMTLSAAQLVRYPVSLLEFLPHDKFAVSLDGFVPKDSAMAAVTEEYARESLCFPLDYQPDCLLLATPNPQLFWPLLPSWRFSVDVQRLVIAFAEPAAVTAAIERSSPFPGGTEYSTGDRQRGGPPVQGGVLESGQANRRRENYLESILNQAVALPARQVLLLPERGAVTPLYWSGDRRLTHSPLSHKQMDWLVETLFQVLGLQRAEYYGTQVRGRFRYHERGLRHTIETLVRAEDAGFQVSFSFGEKVEIQD